MDQLLKIESNRTLDKIEIEKTIDAILSGQSKHLTEQLDLPSFYSQLPFNTKWQIKEIIFDKQLSYHQKHEVIFDLITRLPSSERRFPEPSDHPDGPDEHSRLFDSYNALKYTVSFTFVS
ncbi:hypothetical protein AAVH_41047 [Aphelenchoides avenae]|nr:hypothetical protein AAVH_41047 [Aphelenchus avenae]